MSRKEFNTSGVPLAYLITFRTYGTWLHGDKRGSIDRHNNRFGAPYTPRSPSWERHNKNTQANKSVVLNAEQRYTVETSIIETCRTLKWGLHARNVRTNHAHAVVSSLRHPDKILLTLKAQATILLRERGLWTLEGSPWAYRGSKRYLWTEDDVWEAVDYVLNQQGEDLT